VVKGQLMSLVRKVHTVIGTPSNHGEEVAKNYFLLSGCSDNNALNYHQEIMRNILIKFEKYQDKKLQTQLIPNLADAASRSAIHIIDETIKYLSMLMVNDNGQANAIVLHYDKKLPATASLAGSIASSHNLVSITNSVQLNTKLLTKQKFWLPYLDGISRTLFLEKIDKVYLLICYGTSENVTGIKFKELVDTYLNHKAKEIVIFLGEYDDISIPIDKLKEEKIAYIKEQEWCSDPYNSKFIQGQDKRITFVTHAKWLQQESYQKMKAYFIQDLLSREEIREKIVDDAFLHIKGKILKLQDKQKQTSSLFTSNPTKKDKQPKLQLSESKSDDDLASTINVDTSTSSVLTALKSTPQIYSTPQLNPQTAVVDSSLEDMNTYWSNPNDNMASDSLSMPVSKKSLTLATPSKLASSLQDAANEFNAMMIPFVKKVTNNIPENTLLAGNLVGSAYASYLVTLEKLRHSKPTSKSIYSKHKAIAIKRDKLNHSPDVSKNSIIIKNGLFKKPINNEKHGMADSTIQPGQPSISVKTSAEPIKTRKLVKYG
jgi:hypothetical protein